MLKMKKILLAIIIANILIRLIHITMPLLEGSATRQIFSAMVAKHFFEEELNILYPYLAVKGNEPFYAALEVQFIPYIAAVFYKVLNGVHTEVLRIISIIFTVLAIYALYKLIKELFDEESALVAIFLFGFSPISIYLGKSANFEMPIIFFNILTIYCFYKWVHTERILYAILANLSFVFSVLFKLPNLYLLLPLSFMGYSKWRWKFVFKNWLTIISFIIILIGQGWLHHLRIIGPDPNWAHFDLGYNIQSIRQCFTSLESYKKVYSDVLNYALTPLGLVFLIIGFLLKPENKNEKILYCWLWGVVIFYLVIPEGFVAHGYYHIHYLPIAAFFIAKAFLSIVKRNYSKFYFADPKIITIIFALTFLLFSSRYSMPFYKVPENKKYVLKTAEYVKEKIGPNELIIASVDSPPTLLYYSNAKGWAIDFSDKGRRGIEMLEDLRRKGATYFVCAYKRELEGNKEFFKYFIDNYRVVFEDDFCLIVDLRKKLNP